MSRVLITGSADGLGLELARQLADQDQTVVVHGRSSARAVEAAEAAPGVHDAVYGDLSSVEETKALAEQANALGQFDAVVHNAGVGYREQRTVTPDGVEHVFAINVLAPYILTALVPAPTLVYLSSGLHQQGDPDLDDLAWERPWDGMQAYCDSKLLDVVLAFTVAERWPEVSANAVEPGWIATKMGGSGAPGTLEEGVQTQLHLLNGTGGGDQSGRLYSRSRITDPNPLAGDSGLQDRLRTVCEQISGVPLPLSAPAPA